MLATRLLPSVLVGLVTASLMASCGRDPLLASPVGGAVTTGGRGGSTGGLGGTGLAGGAGGGGTGGASSDAGADAAPEGGTEVGIGDATLTLVPALGPPLPVGQSIEWKAIVLLGGNRLDVTLDPQMLWQVDDTSVANVAARSGRLTGLHPGTTMVHATHPVLGSASAPVTVTASMISRVDVTPAVLSLGLAESQRLAARAVYADSTQADITDSASWSSDDQRVARVGTGIELPGQVTGAGAGDTMVSAEFAGAHGTAAVSVSGSTQVTMAISPSSLIRALNATARFQAITRQASGATGDVSSVASWTSSSPGDVLALGGGQFRCGANATVTITASYAGLMATASLTCGSAAQITALRLSPGGANSTLLVSARYRLELDAVYSDGTVMRVSSGAQVRWTSSNQAVATIDSTGTLAGVAPGKTIVTAVYNNVSGQDTYTFMGQ